jgi:hypothetical protein
LIRIPRNRRLYRQLQSGVSGHLVFMLGAFERILPHARITDLNTSGKGSTEVVWQDQTRRALRIRIAINLSDSCQDQHTIVLVLQRRLISSGVRAISRTLDLRERNIAEVIAKRISDIFSSRGTPSAEFLRAACSVFDEEVVANHLQLHHKLKVKLADLFLTLRSLAEQSYENKSITFGCIFQTDNNKKPKDETEFPKDFLSRKKYRLLSDGYRSSYLVSSRSALLGFLSLQDEHAPNETRAFFPEWSRHFALASRSNRLGICLTRQGDVLVFDNATLRFTYRFGTWQYWNHTHLIDLLRNAARAQRVPRNRIPFVVRSMYRSALDIAFRRSGGLLVLLRNPAKIRRIVRAGDAIRDRKRAFLDKQFDQALSSPNIQSLPRTTLVELSALDGAVVVDNRGQLLAFGAVLEPKRHGKISRLEGSRTKAAIGASYEGLAVKVSSDGDITVYSGGDKLVQG